MTTPRTGRARLTPPNTKVQQPFGPFTTAAIRAAFGEIMLEVPNWWKLAWHLARHRGLYISNKYPRNGQACLRCTCGTLLAHPLAGAK